MPSFRLYDIILISTCQEQFENYSASGVTVVKTADSVVDGAVGAVVYVDGVVGAAGFVVGFSVGFAGGRVVGFVVFAVVARVVGFVPLVVGATVTGGGVGSSRRAVVTSSCGTESRVVAARVVVTRVVVNGS